MIATYQLLPLSLAGTVDLPCPLFYPLIWCFGAKNHLVRPTNQGCSISLVIEHHVENEAIYKFG